MDDAVVAVDGLTFSYGAGRGDRPWTMLDGLTFSYGTGGGTGHG